MEVWTAEAGRAMEVWIAEAGRAMEVWIFWMDSLAPRDVQHHVFWCQAASGVTRCPLKNRGQSRWDDELFLMEKI